MPQSIGSAATAVAALVAIAALIVSIWAGRRVARKRKFELLLERIDREAAKREDAIPAMMGRSDRKFEALQRQSDDLYRQSAEITTRVAHTEAVRETAAEAAIGQGEAVAAHDVLGGATRD